MKVLKGAWPVFHAQRMQDPGLEGGNQAFPAGWDLGGAGDSDSERGRSKEVNRPAEQGWICEPRLTPRAVQLFTQPTAVLSHFH